MSVLAAYPWRVTFTRAFIAGNLSGRSISDEVRFATEAAARAFTRRAARPSAAYRLSDFRVTRA